jgi:nitrite reductase/ring-hydroxylating ferredoxin subunit
LAELQKDPMTRGDFLGFGVLGTIVGALLTIPPAAFILGPVIDVNVRGESDVPDDWFRAGHVSEVPPDEPKAFVVAFPLNQVYSERQVIEEGVDTQEQTLRNAVWTSWKDLKPPGFIAELGQNRTPGISREQVIEAQGALNVLSSSCAHLGCPVRWLVKEDGGEFLCPCHGGIYDINGAYVGGPPPRGMYRYTYEVREDGYIYVKHEFDVGGDKGSQKPFVI